MVAAHKLTKSEYETIVLKLSSMARAVVAESGHTSLHTSGLVRSDDYTRKAKSIAIECERKGYFKDAGLVNEQLGDLRRAEEAYAKGGLYDELKLLRRQRQESGLN